jgi:hypothetical protein
VVKRETPKQWVTKPKQTENVEMSENGMKRRGKIMIMMRKIKIN